MSRWLMSGCLGLPLLGLALGWYKGGSVAWSLAGLGILLAVSAGGFGLLAQKTAPGRAPALAWGCLWGGLAGEAFLLLLAPFTGLTWVLAPPFHHDAIRLLFMLAASLLFLNGPLAGRWPAPAPGPPASLGAPAWLAAGGVFLVFLALAMGQTAAQATAAGGAAGLKGLLKNPKVVLAGLAIFGIPAALVVARRPAALLGRWLPAAGFALVWAGLAMRLVSGMGPVLTAFPGEALQALFLAVFFWLGWGLCGSPGQKGAAEKVG